MNSHKNAEKYCNEILKTIPYYNNLGDKSEFQKKKFNLISNLVSDLFDFKNSREHFSELSNLIVTSLISLNENSVIDIYSEDEKNNSEKINSYHKKILKQEFNKTIKEYQKLITIGQQFRDLILRFSHQYEGINNVVYCPKFKKNNKSGLLN
ncbi:MAG: hypothetical protein ACTSPD_19470 [Promethearchaeota archaeon]